MPGMAAAGLCLCTQQHRQGSCPVTSGDTRGHDWGVRWLKGTAKELASPLLASPLLACFGGVPPPWLPGAAPSPHRPAAALGRRQEGASAVPGTDPGSRPCRLLLCSAWFRASSGTARCCLQVRA